MNVDVYEDFVNEFTLADGNRKRQKISMVIGAGDGLSAADLSALVEVGAKLTVKYINCGNAPVTSALEFYKN